MFTKLKALTMCYIRTQKSFQYLKTFGLSYASNANFGTVKGGLGISFTTGNSIVKSFMLYIALDPDSALLPLKSASVFTLNQEFYLTFIALKNTITSEY